MLQPTPLCVCVCLLAACGCGMQCDSWACARLLVAACLDQTAAFELAEKRRVEEETARARAEVRPSRHRVLRVLFGLVMDRSKARTRWRSSPRWDRGRRLSVPAAALRLCLPAHEFVLARVDVSGALCSHLLAIGAGGSRTCSRRG